VVREKLGASYSPVAYNDPSRAYDGYGVFHMLVETAPDAVDGILAELRAIAGEAARLGVEQKELDLALEPVLTHIRDVRRTNDYWLNSVLSGSWARPETLDWARGMQEDYASITREEVSVLAARYLDWDRSALVVARPASGQEDTGK
jgi:zinc protease